MPKYFYSILTCNVVEGGETILNRIEVTVEANNADGLFPVVGVLKWAEERFKDRCIEGSMQVESVIEISEGDFNEFNSWREGQGRRIALFTN